jgi:PST family polysaccharide transporter
MNICAKLFFTILIFVVIKKSSDYIFVPLLNSLGFISVGIFSLFFIKRKFNVNFMKPKASEFIYQLKEGWHLFISTFATSLYTTANSFILGLFTNNLVVGYYSAAEKIIKAIEDLISPVFYTVYPYLSRQVEVSKEKALELINKILIFVGLSTFIVSIFIFAFSDLIAKILLGNNYNNSVIILKILAFIPFIGGINIILTSLTMLSFNFKEGFSKIIIGAGIINLLFALSLVPLYSAIGSGIAVNVAELFILISTIIYLGKKNIHFFRK